MSDEAAVVRLKLDGKRYTCPTRGCKSKDFIEVARSTSPVIAPVTSPPTLVRCAVCLTQSILYGVVEVLDPPRNDWRTPGGTAMAPVEGGLWTTLHREYRFNLDVAASAENTKTEAYLDGSCPEMDGLREDWFIVGGHIRTPTPARVWDNPPYQPKGAIEAWLSKALDQALKGVFSAHLIPMASSVGWFNKLVIPFAEWHTFEGRIAFEDPLAQPGDERTSPKQDNLLVIYDPESDVVGHTAVRSAKTGEYVWRRET